MGLPENQLKYLCNPILKTSTLICVNIGVTFELKLPALNTALWVADTQCWSAVMIYSACPVSCLMTYIDVISVIIHRAIPLQ